LSGYRLLTEPLDSFDRELLGLIQRRVPLVREPYAQLAVELGCDERKVLDRLAVLRAPAGLVREISAIFDAAALGYVQALVAMRVAPEHLEAAGAAVAEHPGVSHCYGRTGAYDLWFTLACSPRSRLGLRGTAQALAGRCAAEAHVVLPTLKRYKLDVRFGAADSASVEDGPSPQRGGRPQPSPGAPEPAPEQVRAIRALQIDLPNRADPFLPLGAEAGMDADTLLVHAADFLAAGWMRRYGAVLRHRAAGAKANLLVAWRVEPAAADAGGAKCARLPAVSHCYLRPTSPDWPYNLYTMIHGRNREDCRMTVREIVATTQLREHVELWTVKEYKKERIALFSEEEMRWEHDIPDPS